MIVVAVSNDYWGARAEEVVRNFPDTVIVVDHSGSQWRSLKLVIRGSLPVLAAISIFSATRSLPRKQPQSTFRFKDNSELRSLIARFDATKTILFRAGLIISGRTLEKTDVQNIHCADINGYGGLAAIHRAISASAWKQCATLHRVTNKIDEGEILDREVYELSPSVSYSRNEHLAYEAGLKLLEKTMRAAMEVN